ncbi:hypothetical protein [Corynebacterium comes]|uniref:Uncharacterized protein n=1 Tax=Corynebacterium comes TaxID=2675218 RepID=A0A6B8VKM6_9CORY|nr:hypothetical protein [Corynebacterium comes]QGU04643.1 hypothetical protein CETAM_06910 [Corynebacterium comes]
MSAQPDSSGGLSRDYIVEYRAGQFQNGSLVLRFDAQPTDKQLRDALIAHGLPARALEEVRARPLHPSRPRTISHPGPRTSVPSPTLPETPPARRKQASGCSGGPLLLGLAVAAFALLAGFSDQAIRAGESAGATRTTETMVVGCWDELGVARSLGDPDAGVVGAMFTKEPTAFAVTPANAAFYFSCLRAASTD